MTQHWLARNAPLLLACLGAVLFLVAIAHHWIEVSDTVGISGPAVALIVDATPALGLVFGGYWLSKTDLSVGGQWMVTVWGYTGALLFGGVMGVTVLVRAYENRIVAEPLFPLLVTIEAGAIAGVVAGYFNALARKDARRAETLNTALAFVNSLIRHDIRNDLTVIQMHVDLLDTDPPADGDDPGHDSVSIIDEKIDEALTRIETSRAIADTLIGETDLERVDLVSITEEITTKAERVFEATISVDLPEQAPVLANAGLRSVVDNLVENADSHNDADEPRIDVDLETGSETVRLAVADNGPGIPDHQKGSMFHADEPVTERGGLALVETLVEEYGGDVWIEDNEPHGTVFLVELPKAERGMN